MLEVDINKIIPITEARDNFNKLVEDVSASDALYVLTTNGKPSAVIVGVHHLEKLTGQSDAAVVAKMSNLANNLGGNMEDPMTSAAPADDTMPVADDSAVPAVAEDTTPVAAPDMTPAAPVADEVVPAEPAGEITPDAPVEDPFAMSMPAETPAPEVPAAPVAEPEAPVAPAAPAEDADDSVLPNIGGQA